MSTTIPRALMAIQYERYAQEYQRSLPLEHYMESIPQATQREITVASLALVRAQRGDFHVFNELLVQYPRKGKKRPGQVVPDNMVVISEQAPRAQSSYNIPLEPAGPFWIMEYVSKSNPRKDYEDNFQKYERDLKVPYYLLFNPDAQELTLFRHDGAKYKRVKASAAGRHAIPELDIEVALVDGWVRYWHKGQLLLLPADLQEALEKAKREAEQERQRAEHEKQRADREKDRADREKQRADALEAEVARLRAAQK